MHFEVQIGHPGLKVRLHVGHGLVVDAGPDLLQQKAEQAAGGDVADLLVPVLAEVALDRGPGLSRSLSGLGIVGCEAAAAVHFLPDLQAHSWAMGLQIRQKLSSLGPLLAIDAPSPTGS